ncbi:MAG: alpha/beta fold hydrolase [Thermodesulfobacteriota bacterium]|nr:alpha/beta fold hydrolase [Thermodesulfobacteriota bacterium]
MHDHSENRSTLLDHPMVLARIFHPRPVDRSTPVSEKEVMIPVAEDVVIGACFHMTDRPAPTILFFHGNGEIVSDYDDLGMVYNRAGINFIVVDYRGYGRSTGTPSVTAMMADSCTIFEFVRQWLVQNKFPGPLTVMGRSLGSASALELAARVPAEFDNLIIESGFARAGELLRILGIDPDAIGFKETTGFNNPDKIRKWNKPCLIIHAEFDHIIPFSDGQALFDACPAPEKKLVKIKGANHNDIFFQDLDLYMASIKELTG